MKTMNRWIRILVVAFAALVTGLAYAQGIRREAPKDVVAGRMVVTTPPQITMDGKPDRLSPGSRIRDLNNLLVLSGSIAGKQLPVVYRRDAAGLVHEVWILTEAEYSKLPGASNSLEGHKRFDELLGIIFGSRK
jgi:hypothetical protein